LQLNGTDMNHFNRFLPVLPVLLALFTTPWAHAGDPAATIDQLSGWAMAVKADGRILALAIDSKIEAGDTLVTEKDSFARLVLGDGNNAILGPQTTLAVARLSAQAMHLSVTSGVLQVTTTGGLTMEAAGTKLDGKGTFVVNHAAAPSPALADSQQRYLRNSFAALASPVLSDAGGSSRVEWIVAQNIPRPPSAGPGGGAPGLYVHVIDGLISLTNTGGANTFSAGQFGFVPSVTRPPVILPNNPGLTFTPPPTFSSTKPGATQSGSKPAAVDCEVR